MTLISSAGGGAALTAAPVNSPSAIYGVDLTGENRELRMIRRIQHAPTRKGKRCWTGFTDNLRITLWDEDMRLLADTGHLPDDREPEYFQDLPDKEHPDPLNIPVYTDLYKGAWRIITVEPPEVMPVWAQPANLWVKSGKLEKGDIIYLRKGRPVRVVTVGVHSVTVLHSHPVSGYEHSEFKTLKFATGQLIPVERRVS